MNLKIIVFIILISVSRDFFNWQAWIDFRAVGEDSVPYAELRMDLTSSTVILSRAKA